MSKSSRSREARERPPLQAEERERTKGRMYSRPQCDRGTERNLELHEIRLEREARINRSTEAA